MKKIIALSLCLNILAVNFAFADVLKDSLAEQLDKNLKPQNIKAEPIKDDFALRTLNPNLKIQKANKVYYEDELVLKTLNPNLKITKQPQRPIEDELARKIDKTNVASTPLKMADSKFDEGKIKISPKRYYTTRVGLYEGGGMDFVLVEDAKIKNAVYKKGTPIKARVETLSQNKAYGVPADLVVGNFTLPDNTILNGQIERQGANRSLWVYPTGYVLMPFFLIGTFVLPIRGGHVKLRPEKVYEIDI